MLACGGLLGGGGRIALCVLYVVVLVVVGARAIKQRKRKPELPKSGSSEMALVAVSEREQARADMP